MPFLTDLYNTSSLEQAYAYLLKRGVNLTDADNILLGDTSGYVQISKTNGILSLKGAAHVWKDMVADLYGKRLYSTVGGVDYDYENNAIIFQPNGDVTNTNDRVGANLSINHEYKVGSSINFYIHFHWFQTSIIEAEFTLRYRIQRNGQPKSNAWTTITTVTSATNNVWEYTGGELNQITNFPTITIDCSISDTIQLQLARTDRNSGDISMYSLEVHGKVDALGSGEILFKDE